MKVKYDYSGKAKDGAHVLAKNAKSDTWRILCSCGAQFDKGHRGVQMAFKGWSMLRCRNCFVKAQRTHALEQIPEDR